MSPALSRALADGVLAIHAAFVAFVVLGLLLVLAGGVFHWRWVRHPWFRRAHLAAIGIVVLQAWCGVICPLTLLESRLRENAGGTSYQTSFIAHWLHRLLFFDAPPWVFTLAYTLFALAVAASWFWVRPVGRCHRGSVIGDER